jgi:protein-L-isoaspartate(D-aspartate) O-methyltransferase
MNALAESARRRLEEMGYQNVRYFVGDGSAGWPEAGLVFDRILVTAGAPRVPEPLTRQLADGGILIIPVGDGGVQTLIRVERHGETVRETPSLACRFVPLVGAHAWGG